MADTRKFSYLICENEFGFVPAKYGNVAGAKELGLLVAGELTGNEYKELEGVAEDLLGQARDLKYPYLPRAL